MDKMGRKMGGNSWIITQIFHHLTLYCSYTEFFFLVLYCSWRNKGMRLKWVQIPLQWWGFSLEDKNENTIKKGVWIGVQTLYYLHRPDIFNNALPCQFWWKKIHKRHFYLRLSSHPLFWSFKLTFCEEHAIWSPILTILCQYSWPPQYICALLQELAIICPNLGGFFEEKIILSCCGYCFCLAVFFLCVVLFQSEQCLCIVFYYIHENSPHCILLLLQI